MNLAFSWCGSICYKFRFSSIAAERASSSRQQAPSTSASSARSIQKPHGKTHRAGRGHGMDIDRPTTSSPALSGEGSSQRNRPGRRGKDNKSNRSRNQRDPVSRKQKPASQTDLDRDLESYMMKDAGRARAALDMDIDTYMASAPAKSA